MEHSPSDTSILDDSFVVIDSDGNDENDGKEEEKNMYQASSLEMNVHFHLKLNSQCNEESLSPKIKTSLPIFPPTENDLIGNNNNKNYQYDLHRPDQVAGIQLSDCKKYDKNMSSEKRERTYPDSENETQLLNSEVNTYNMLFNVDPDDESRKDKHGVYIHHDLSKDNDKGRIIDGALSRPLQDESVQNRHQGGYDNYTGEQTKYDKNMSSEKRERTYPDSENETQLLNSEVNTYNMLFNVDPDDESRKDKHGVYIHHDLSKDNDKGRIIDGALSRPLQDESVQNRHQGGYDNYTGEQTTPYIETEQCYQANEDEDIGNIDINDENKKDNDKNVGETYKLDTTNIRKVSLENEQHAYNAKRKATQLEYKDNLTKSTSDENDETDNHSDENDETDKHPDEMYTRPERDKDIQEGAIFERDVRENDKENEATVQDIEGENVEQDEVNRKRSDGTLPMKCSPKKENKSRLNPHENGECETVKLGVSLKFKTEMKTSNNNQFYVREDENNPQKCHSNDDEGNKHSLVEYGGQLTNVTTSPSNHEFQIPDGIAKEKTESSEREGLECYTKQESSNKITVTESNLVKSFEQVEGHKSAESLDNELDQIKLKDSEETTSPREKLFQASLETMGAETNQKSAAVKQNEITDGLQINTETDKIPVAVKTEHGEVRLIKVGKFYLISINGKKSKLPKSVSQDTDLRLENIENDILLLTNTICYRVRIEQDKIVLEYVSDKSRPLLPSSESHNAKQTSANELNISNGTERETKDGSLESENKSNDVQDDINEQRRFKTDEKDTSDSRSESTHNESSSNQGKGEKTMKLQDDFKDIALIKVGKFWLISVNERKSKLPKTINQDPNLRIERDGTDLLLLSDTCCYKIRQSANNITLDEYKSYFERALNENISGCARTDDTTDQCGEYPDRTFDKYKQDVICTETSDRESKEHTEVIRKGSYDIETEEAASTNNDRPSLPFDYRSHLGANLAAMNGNLNNGENENQNDKNMTNASEIATDAKQDKYCQDQPESECKKTRSQEDFDYLTHGLESMNLKDQIGRASPTVSELPKITDQGCQELLTFTDEGYKRNYTSLEAKELKLQALSPVVQIEGNEDENLLRLRKQATKSIGLPAHIPWPRLIPKFNIASKIEETFNSVKVDMEMMGPITSVKITGSEKDIEAAEKYVQSEIIDTICQEEIVIHFQNMAVFKQPRLCDCLERQLGGGALLLLENKKLFAYSFKRDNLMKAKLMLCTLVQEQSVPLTGKWRSEDAIKHMVEMTVNNTSEVFTSTNQTKTSIIITGLKEHVERISAEIKEIQQFGKIKNDNKPPGLASSAKIANEQITYLQPCNVWQRLAHKFNIKATLESVVESVKVEFRKDTNEHGHVCALVITGTKYDTELVRKHFEHNYNDKLFRKDVQLNVKRMDVFKNTDICDVLERKFADVLVWLQHDCLTLFSFSLTVGNTTADAIRKELTGECISVHGYSKQEDMVQLVDEFKRNSEGVYYLIDMVESSLYVAGFKENTAKVINELSQKMVRDRISTIWTKIENNEAFEVLKYDANFLNELKQRLGLVINIQNTQRCFEIKGEHTDVILCEQEIQQYCMDVISEQTENYFKESDHVISKEFEAMFDTIAEQNDVIIQRSLTNKSRPGISFADEETGKKSFLFPNEHKLILLDQPEDDHCSDFIVQITEASDNIGATRRMVNQQSVVEMNIPYFKIDDVVIDITKNIIKSILQEAEKDKESVVEFKLPLMKTWSVDDMAYCWISAIHKYFMNVDKNTNPKFVILCQPKETSYHYFVDCCKLQAEKVTDVYSATKRTKQPRFKITVLPGKLNEMQADVLVNTVNANLDLRLGAVSNALLTTAGQQLQTEVSKCYPHNLRRGQIAITGGYYLKCNKVFHGALDAYDERNLQNITKQFRQFVQTCLFKASEYKATSIAFPAIGTGNLRYPLEFVVREMYDVVNEYEQKGYETFLKHVFFVVFPGDHKAVDVFKKRKAQEERRPLSETTAREAGWSQHQQPNICLKINVIGHKDKVKKARQTIDEIVVGKKKVIPVKTIKSPSYADDMKMPKGKTDLTTHSKPSMDIKETLSEPIDIRHAFQCFTVEGLTVRVYSRNILSLPVDCIVNAANEQLEHHSGIALAIAKAAGNNLIKESKDLVQRYGYVATGKAIRTNPGQLKYKCVIHAVGPNWHDYSPYTVENVSKCLEHLKQAIISSLESAEQFSMSTIAIPAVSSASFAVPKELCAMQYVKAVQMFSANRPKRARTLAEVHFVDLDERTIRLIKEAFSKKLIDKQPYPWNWRIYVEKRSADATGRHQASSQVKDDQYPKRCPYYIEDGQTLTCKYTPTREVSVSKGDIFNFNDVDVIVCSEDESGQAAGGVAKLLLKKCGYQYEQEKKSIYKRKNPKTGEVHMTGGGNSRYRCIMHAIMPHRLNCKTEQQWIKALEDMVNTIFNTAEKNGYKTMVMPLLGTGAGKSDPKRCAEILLDCFTLSCTRYKDSLFHLRVVNTDMERNRIVTNVFREHITQAKKYLEDFEVTKDKKEKKGDESTCVICLDHVKHPKILNCGHTFCSDCIDQHFKIKAVCPSCGTVCGIILGDQPDGDMTIETIDFHLAGYKAVNTIKITYCIDSGKQRQNHPNSGKAYKGIERIAFLPNNNEGRELVQMLKLAFERRLVFTIGSSRTTGEEGVITWNDIHHKTNYKKDSQFGYPDPTYFNRVRDELAAKGVTANDPDLDKFLPSKLDNRTRCLIPVRTRRSAGNFETRV